MSCPKAHTNGINYAVQDAAAAANILPEPLKLSHISVGHLAAVQRRRNWPTRVRQAIVTRIQDRVLGPAMRTSGGMGAASAGDHAPAAHAPAQRPAARPARTSLRVRRSGVVHRVIFSSAWQVSMDADRTE